MSDIPMHDCATKSPNATGDFLVKGRPRSIYCVVRGDAYAPRSQAFRIEGGVPVMVTPNNVPRGWVVEGICAAFADREAAHDEMTRLVEEGPSMADAGYESGEWFYAVKKVDVR
jgi:hypothetical protein